MFKGSKGKKEGKKSHIVGEQQQWFSWREDLWVCTEAAVKKGEVLTRRDMEMH